MRFSSRFSLSAGGVTSTYLGSGAVTPPKMSCYPFSHFCIWAATTTTSTSYVRTLFYAGQNVCIPQSNFSPTKIVPLAIIGATASGIVYFDLAQNDQTGGALVAAADAAAATSDGNVIGSGRIYEGAGANFNAGTKGLTSYWRVSGGTGTILGFGVKMT